MKNGSEYDSITNENLVIKAKTGDEKSLCILLERFSDIINSSISMYIDNSLERDDMQQEAHMGLLKAINNFDENRNTSFRTFAALCINNALLNFIKSKNAKKIVSRPDFTQLDSFELDFSCDSNESNPEHIFIDREQSELLREMIKKLLSPLEYDVFNCVLAGMSYEQTALKLSLNAKAVDNALQRVRRKLRDILG